MATRAPATTQNPAQLCDYCQQKPKFSNHSYCSKTCAAQAAKMCDHCHKKPKYQNFAYCGKNCASLANGSKKPAAGQGTPAGAPQATVPNTGNNLTKNNAQKPSKSGSVDPLQLAQIVAQSIPQIQALLATVNSAAGGSKQQPSSSSGPTAQPLQVTSKSQRLVQGQPINNPFLNSMASQAAAVATGAGPSNGISSTALSHVLTSSTQLQPQRSVDATAESDADDGDAAICLIPSCDQPVHVDPKGMKTSDYCSTRHRKEAVETGIASPCIMCLTLPQSYTDYFCSKACRDEALNKYD